MAKNRKEPRRCHIADAVSKRSATKKENKNVSSQIASLHGRYYRVTAVDCPDMKIIRDPIESGAVSIVIGEHEIDSRSFTSLQESSLARSLKIEVGKSMIPGKNVN